MPFNIFQSETFTRACRSWPTTRATAKPQSQCLIRNCQSTFLLNPAMDVDFFFQTIHSHSDQLFSFLTSFFRFVCDEAFFLLNSNDHLLFSGKWKRLKISIETRWRYSSCLNQNWTSLWLALVSLEPGRMQQWRGCEKKSKLQEWMLKLWPLVTP